MPATYSLRPDPDEHASYQGAYIQLVPDEDIIALLATQLGDTLRLFDGLSEAQAETGYAPGKWSFKELLGHLADTERVFAYRALRISRGDATPLPGFEQDDYVAALDFNACTLDDLERELRAVRAATVYLFRNLPEEAMTRAGTTSGHRFTVRAAAYTIAGHERHHRRFLETRYLPAL